jgi:hypothetical protein
MRIDRLYASERETDPDPAAALERRRTIASGLERLRAEDPERYEAALLQLRRYDQRMARFGLRDRTLDWSPSTMDAVQFAAREGLLAVVLIPLALAAAVAFFVPYFLTAGVARLQQDTDVTATAKVISGAVFYPVWTLVTAVLIGTQFGATWGFVDVAALPALAIAGLFAFERETAALRTARAWLALRGAHPRTRRRLRRHRAELADILDDVNTWLAQP